jgi:dienelactone hydrolase
MGTVMADNALIEISAGGQVSLTPVIRLWPDAPPSGLPGVGSEITFPSPAIFGPETDMLRNVSDPSLTVFMPDPAKANGVGAIVCPGGAWRVLAWEHEGINPARWLAARGYTAFLLKYRVLGSPSDPVEFAAAVNKMAASMSSPIPGAKAPRALADAIRDESIVRAREIAADDGRRAIEIVRERAAEWSVRPDRIGMIGFSAGAFLTTDVALDPRAAPLAFVAPIYGGEDPGPRRAGRRTAPVHGGRTGRSDVFPSGRGPLCRLVQRRSPGRTAHLHPRWPRFWRRQARLAGGSLDRSAGRLAGGSGGRLAGFAGFVSAPNCAI